MLNYFVTGTGTDIGKTVVTTLLTDFLSNKHHTFFPFKPIQTGASLTDGKLIAPDQEVYKNIVSANAIDLYDTYLFKIPSSPHFAAKQENKLIDVEHITNQIKEIKKLYEGIIVEGAGGLYVPITDSGYCIIDYIKELSFPVILVADAGVGTINHTVLSIKAMQTEQIPITGVIFNRSGSDELLEQDNINMIEKLTNVPLIGTVPFVDDIEKKLQDKQMRKWLTKDWNKNIFAIKEQSNEYRTIATME